MWCVARFGTICIILKNVKNTDGGVLILGKLQATLLKLALFHGCFLRFLNCTNGTKPRNAPHISYHMCECVHLIK